LRGRNITPRLWHDSPDVVIGLGLELLQLDGVRRSLDERGTTWAEATWTEGERASCYSRVDPAPGLSARLAAKIAALSALGEPAGSLLEIEIVRQPSGKPDLVLHGRAREAADRLGVSAVHVTLTHAETHVVAFVLLEGSPP
jgi:holo-[acyl-carrier protein] synthase